MSSPVEGRDGSRRDDRTAAATFLVWNRRLHYYLGLYFLFFCWLFALTGLLLNHPRWQFAQFWPNRVETVSEHQVAVAHDAPPQERARAVMRQVGLRGEIQWPAVQSASGAFAFQVSRPGLVADVKLNSATGRATVRRTRVNTWGLMRVLHTFTGVRAADARNQRDWLLTTVWALTMDAVAAALIVMVFSSYVMWYRLKAKRRAGVVALLLGIALSVALLTGVGPFL